jgi:sensor histidine kinase YesM
MRANSQRVLRHSAFWMTRVAFLTITHFIFYYDTGRSIIGNYGRALHVIPGLILIAEVPFCYLMSYVFVPRYLIKKRYGVFLLSFLLTSAVLFVCATFYLYWNEGWQAITPDELFQNVWSNATSFIILGPPGVCLIFISLRLLRNWRIEQERTQALLQATTEVEIRLLQSQIHPHFLFNTLNNIYSFALEGSPVARQLIRQLSDMLRYIVEHCSDTYVSVDRELGILENYIELERVRYGDRLNIVVDIRGRPSSKAIAPQLMLPLLENSFKHGTSQTLKAAWIKLSVTVEGDLLHFSLANGKPADNGDPPPGKGGIGLANVQKRLALMYPSGYLLDIRNTPAEFMVDMRVPLHPLIPSSGSLPG